jgi:hypothetical protein
VYNKQLVSKNANEERKANWKAGGSVGHQPEQDQKIGGGTTKVRFGTNSY